MFLIAIVTIAVLWLISVDWIHFEHQDGRLNIIVETKMIRTLVQHWLTKAHNALTSLFRSQQHQGGA